MIYSRNKNIDRPVEISAADAKTLILKQISRNPGIKYMELLRLTGLSNGKLEYHLNILEKTQKLKTDRLDGGRKGYYSLDILENEFQIVTSVRNDVSRQIVTFIHEHEPCTFKEILEHTNKAPSTLSWHLNRLSKAAIISIIHGKDYQLYRVLNSKLIEEILYKYGDGYNWTTGLIASS
jgi:predicted transcriptional regulator